MMPLHWKLHLLTMVAVFTANTCVGDPLRFRRFPVGFSEPDSDPGHMEVNRHIANTHTRQMLNTEGRPDQERPTSPSKNGIIVDRFQDVRNLPSFSASKKPSHLWRKSGAKRLSPDSSRADIIICNLCPMAEEIIPCKCTCKNGTSAELTCGPDLLTCTELTDILTMASFPAPHYIRLKVDGTQLKCNIEEDLWGAALTFEEVYLVNNHFEVLDNNAFDPFNSTLNLINLDSNALTAVYFHTMNDLPHLRTLLLNDNEIDFIPGNTALELQALQVMEVSKNKLCNLQPNTFAGLPRLEVLDLSHNNIRTLKMHSLRIFNHVARHLLVNVSNNIISTIEENAWSGVQSLELDLRNNALVYLLENVLRPLVDETQGKLLIRVNGNPLNCDSTFCWIFTNESMTNYFDNFLCPNLNKYISDVTADDLGGCGGNRK